MIGLVALGVSVAVQSGKPVMVYNYPSADSCATWTLERRDKTSQALEGWVLGVVTGYNIFKASNGNIAPSVKGAGLTGWIDQYCATNPLDSVTTATFKLIRELERRAGQ